MVGHTRCPFGGQQIFGDGAEERDRLLRGQGRGPGDVDHGIHTCQRFGQASRTHQIDSGGAGQDERIMAGGLHRLDDMAANGAGASGDRDSHTCCSFRAADFRGGRSKTMPRRAAIPRLVRVPIRSKLEPIMCVA